MPDRPEDRQPLENVNAKDDSTSEALREAARDGATGSYDKASKLPDVCEKGLGCRTLNELHSTVDAIQDQRRPVLPEVEKRGTAAGLNSKEVENLSQTVKDNMTYAQNVRELDRCMANICKLSGNGHEYVSPNFSDLDKDGVQQLFGSLNKIVSDYTKRMEP